MICTQCVDGGTCSFFDGGRVIFGEEILNFEATSWTYLKQEIIKINIVQIFTRLKSESNNITFYYIYKTTSRTQSTATS